MTKEQMRDDAFRIAGEESARLASALRSCKNPEQLHKIISDFQKRFDEIFQERLSADNDKIDCKAGCYFCCYIKVDVYAWDVFPLVRYMEQNFSKEQIADVHLKAKERRAKTQNLTYEEQERMRLPCPLLLDGKCSVYPARPLTCRRHHSARVAACESGFHDPEREVLMMEVEQVNAALALVTTSSARVLKEAGYDDTWYDLSAAVDEALSNPKAYKRWRDGKRPFSQSAVATNPSESLKP